MPLSTLYCLPARQRDMSMYRHKVLACEAELTQELESSYAKLEALEHAETHQQLLVMAIDGTFLVGIIFQVLHLLFILWGVLWTAQWHVASEFMYSWLVVMLLGLGLVWRRLKLRKLLKDKALQESCISREEYRLERFRNHCKDVCS
jgi:hypothetical protein